VQSIVKNVQALEQLAKSYLASLGTRHGDYQTICSRYYNFARRGLSANIVKQLCFKPVHTAALLTTVCKLFCLA